MNLFPFLRRRALKPRTWLAAAIAVTAIGLPVAQAGEDIGAIAVKRYFLGQVNQRCHLFDPATASALKAGYVQARNSALRNGYTMAQLAPWLDRSRQAAAATACQAPQVVAEATLARDSFRGFAAQSSLYLPTLRTAWRASRAQATAPAWRLVQFQDTPQADAALGLYGSLTRNRFAVMASFRDGTRPFSARLLVRDPTVAQIGLIDPTPYGLSRAMPQDLSQFGFLSFPASAASETSVNLSPAVSANAAGFGPTGAYVGTQVPEIAQRFDFPTRAFSAIAQLDPREDIIVVFDCQDGERFLRFEVGDFITGLTYIGLPSPYGQPAA